MDEVREGKVRKQRGGGKKTYTLKQGRNNIKTGGKNQPAKGGGDRLQQTAKKGPVKRGKTGTKRPNQKA